MMQNVTLKLLKLFLLVITFLWLFINIDKLVNFKPLHEDGLSNLKLAYSIAHYGTMGDIGTANTGVIVPSNEREPFPNWLTAKWIKHNQLLINDKLLNQRQSPQQLVKLKEINTYILLCILVGVFVLSRQLFKLLNIPNWCFVFAYLTLLLSYACMHTYHVNYLITEIHGALLIVWFSWVWLKLFQTQSAFYAVLSGLLLGLLILTKAAFLYISIALMVVVITVFLIQRKSRKVILNQLLLLIVTMCLVLPWMCRNYVHLGKFEVTGRGPIVLMTRAFKNQMTDEEFKGAFYAYAPASLKKMMKNITGFSSRDRELGGRLQRFYRAYAHDEICRDLYKENCAIAYYYQASIRYKIIMRTYQQLYPNNPQKATLLGENAAKNYAINLIKSNPWGHLRTTLVFAWRGAWPCNKVDGRWYKLEKLFLPPAWQEIMPFLGLISMFGLAITALVKKQDELIAFTWLGSATFLFYSLATHFIPRYSEMMIPIWVLCFVYVCAILFKKLTQLKVFQPMS